MPEKEWAMGIGTGIRKGDGTKPDEVVAAKASSNKAKQLDRAEEIDAAAHDAKMAKIEKDKKEAVAAAAAAVAGPPGPAVDFKVTGSVDINEQARKAETAAASALQRSDEERKAALEKVDKLSDDLALNRYNALNQQMLDMRTSMTEEIKKLLEGKKDTVAEKLKEMEELAPRLGFEKREAGVVGGDDPRIQLEITKMNIDAARAEREFKWKMRQDDRNYDREQRRDDTEAALRTQEIDDKRKGREMLAGAPAAIGHAIATGLRTKPVEGGPQSKGGQSQSGVRKHVEAGPGDYGKIDCPDCQQPNTIAIGPTATSAVCGSCGYRLTVTRGKGPAGEPAETEEQGG